MENEKTASEGLPTIVFTDIDGVWTDGGMYYDEFGNELKRFDTRDSAGVRFLKTLGIPIVILTGERAKSVKERAFKLNIPDLYQGVTDKLYLAKECCEERGTDLSRAAYIGDDVNDLPLLRKVGISAAPSDAPSYVRDEVDMVTEAGGGRGAFRAFVEELLERKGKLQGVLQSCIRGE